MLNKGAEPIKVIADILQSEMGLTSQQILLANQKFRLPQDGTLMVILGYISKRPMATSNEAVSDGPLAPAGMTEQQASLWQAQVQIDLFAYNKPAGGNDARQRVEEAVLALNSIYAEQAMDLQEMQIARLPAEFLDASAVEGVEMLQRFTATIAIKYAVRKEKAGAPYFDKFPNDSTVQPEVTLNV